MAVHPLLCPGAVPGVPFPGPQEPASAVASKPEAAAELWGLLLPSPVKAVRDVEVPKRMGEERKTMKGSTLQVGEPGC